jgi:SRSO17 transposase
MELTEEFGRYLGHISARLGRAERKAGLQEYCRALMLPLQRKSIEPLAAAIDPYHVPALHQSLHHFVATEQIAQRDDAHCARYQTHKMQARAPKM